ncbi:MAG: hypothetical protein ABIT70_06640 [Sulfuriferula sp.]
MKPAIPNLIGIAPEVTRILEPMKEVVEILAARRGSREDQALSPVTIANMPVETARYAAGATPTQAEFNLLVDDVNALRAQINVLITKLR